MNYKNTIFLNLLIFLIGGTSLSLAMETNKEQTAAERSITLSGSNGINTFFDMFPPQKIESLVLNTQQHDQIEKQIIQNTPSIKERVKHLYELGNISDITTLRQELKKWGYDKEAWDRVNTIGAGPTPMMIAQRNKYNGNAILLYNYNRSNDPFFQAIMFGDKSKIDDILNKNPEKINEDIVIDNGCCSCLPISWAISLEDEELVKYLLEKGAKIDIKTSIGIRPFDEACSSPKILKLMEPYGGKELQNQKDFFEAAGKDDIERMKEIVACNTQSKIDIIRGSLGIVTPLRRAILAGSVEAAQYLINKGAFINIPELDSYKRELFLDACMYKKIPVMQLLVKESDIKFYLNDRFNKHCPFNYCLSDEVKGELFALYKKHHTTTGQGLLSLTARLGHKNLIQQTLDEDIDINEYDSGKMTALLWACSYGNPDIMSFLIQHGADVNAVDKKGRCCLRKLIRMHKTSPQKYGRQLTTSELLPCLFLLVCYGADKDIEDKCGKSPLDWIKKQKFNTAEKELINRVLDACQLSRNDLKCLLDDIYDFQCEELKGAQEKCDEHAIDYIKRSLVKRKNEFFGNWSKPHLKDVYKYCIILVGPVHITLTSGVFQEDVEKVIWFIDEQNKKGCNQLKIIHDGFPYQTIDKVLYIDKVLNQVISQSSSLPSFTKSYKYERTPGAHLLIWGTK